MRVFLSAFSGFTLAVPMSAVAAMMLYDKKTENQYTYISLPRLFNLNEEEAHHGIILRGENGTTNKIVLLTAEIKRDIEIPDKEFHPIPKSLGALRFSKIFSGIKFSDNPVLLLNIEQITQLLQEEQYEINTKNNSTKPPPEEQPPPEQPLPEQPPMEQPPPEELLSEQTLAEQTPSTVTSEVEPLTELLVPEELPSEEPPPTVASEIEPLTELLVPEELPSEEPPEEIPIEETPEEMLVEEPPEELLVEEPPATAASEVEPLADLLVLEDLP